jgi:hypothetical protein
MQCSSIPISIRLLCNHQSLSAVVSPRTAVYVSPKSSRLVQPDKSLLGLLPYRKETFASCLTNEVSRLVSLFLSRQHPTPSRLDSLPLLCLQARRPKGDLRWSRRRPCRLCVYRYAAGFKGDGHLNEPLERS